jgi:selenocysteine lyase/cysteine desulfurase
MLEGIGMDRLGAHVASLTRVLLHGLWAMRHPCGAPLVAIHGPMGMEHRGGTVALNLLRPDGSVVDYRVVEARARQAGISVRGGCFCNPGAAEHAFGFAPGEAARCFGAVMAEGFDLDRLRACMGGRPVGAIRASLGMASVESDVARFLDLLAELRDQAGSAGERRAAAA